MTFSAKTYHDIAVSPFSSFRGRASGKSEHKGGPNWPDWNDDISHRFHRVMGPLDDRPDPTPIGTPRIASGHHWWIGPVERHFGHFAAEIASRILPTLLEDPKAQLVFGANFSRTPALVNFPSFYSQAVEWFGGSSGRMSIVDAPRIFEHLSVVPQPEVIGRKPSEAFLEALTENAHRRLGKISRRGVLLVSRSKQRGTILGEQAVERAIEATGVTVMRPEEHSLREQLDAYASHETVVCSEGSALHGLRFLGKNLGRLVIISRRSSRVMPHALLPRCDEVIWVNAVRTEVRGLSFDGTPDRAQSIAEIDLPSLVDQLTECGIGIDGHLDRNLYSELCQRDLSVWLDEVGWRRAAVSQESLDYLVGTLHASSIPNANAEAIRLIEKLTQNR